MGSTGAQIAKECFLGHPVHMAKDHEFEAALAKMSKLVVATSLRNVITVQRV